MNIVSHIVRWRGAVVSDGERAHRKEALIQGNGRKAWVSVTADDDQTGAERLLELIGATLKEWGVTVD